MDKIIMVLLAVATCAAVWFVKIAVNQPTRKKGYYSEKLQKNADLELTYEELKSYSSDNINGNPILLGLKH